MNNNSKGQKMEKLKEIPKWSRRYAQNRSLTILTILIITFLMGAFGVVPPALILIGYLLGSRILVIVGIIALVVFVAFYISLCKKYGGKNRERLDLVIDRWIYAKEGTASMPEAGSSKKEKWIDIVIGTIWLILFIGTMYLGMEDYIPAKYVQPVSALYCIPYQVFCWYYWRGPRMGPIVLFAPILYAVHAILILAGVPLYFNINDLAAFNMTLPFIGYSILSYVIAHYYSRYSLKKLKTAANLGESNNEQ